MRNKITDSVIIILCIMVLTACSGKSGGSAGEGSTTPTLTLITVTPANPSVRTGETAQFTSVATYSDNTTQNISGSVTWSSSNTSKATISNTGLATGVAVGTTTITATSGNISGTTALTVVTSNVATSFTGNFLGWTDSTDASHSMMLVRIYGHTGDVVSIGGYNAFWALAYGPDGRLYGVGPLGALYIINPTNGDTSKIGDLRYQGGAPINMLAAAFSPDGKLFVSENSGSRVFTVDLTTGALNLMGTFASNFTPYGLAFAADGTLYASFGYLSTAPPSLSTSLSTVNTSNMSIMSTLGGTGANIGNLAFGSVGVLYGLGTTPAAPIYSINLNTGIATAVTPSLGSRGVSCIIAERTPPVYPAPQLQNEVEQGVFDKTILKNF